MTEPTNHNSRKITLEDLLRLKRHERPGPEYWVRFDRELNEKVWRALTNPPEPRTGLLPVWLGRGMRWMTAGAVSALAVMLAWPTGTLTTISSPIAAIRTTTTSASFATPVAATSAAPIQVAYALTAPVEVAPAAQTTFAVANLAPSISPAGYDKIPATLSLPAAQMNGGRFASDGLNSSAFSASRRGSVAY